MIIAFLVVMGLGMGATMMPLFTSALKTLTQHEVARGSTLLNITQQVASSCGVALMSVLLTNHLQGARTPAEAASAFSDTFWVAWALVGLTLLWSFRLLDDEGVPPTVVH